MTFRRRLVLTVAVASLLPLAIFGLLIRREMTARLHAQADLRVGALAERLGTDLDREVGLTRRRLRGLSEELRADNRFRLATLSGGDRRWLLDWAGEAMRASGLAMLVVQDSAGRIESSGQFRNDFDRLDPSLPANLATAGQAVVDVATPDGPIRVLATIDSLRVSGQRFTIAGGSVFDSTRVASLALDPEIGARLVIGGESGPAGPVTRIPVRYLDDRTGQADSARVIVTRDPGPALALRRRVDQWLAVAMALALVGAIVLAAWLGTMVSRPLAALAEKTAQVDLDRLDQDFGTDRADEIGALARLLDAMTKRLRSGAARLRESERRATMGDLARQINHDIKNGLAPIRHVVRHLSQTAERDPDQVGPLYLERRGTLESSIEYLENLARNYAKLSPALARAGASLEPVVREVIAGIPPERATIELRLAAGLPALRADAVVVRRIVENLVANAVDALEGKAGRVTISAEGIDGRAGSDGRLVRIVVADSGRGMSRGELDRAFDDFYTTKPGGTGLGLSVVRRLLTDLGGSVRVETVPGQGSVFMVEIPAA